MVGGPRDLISKKLTGDISAASNKPHFENHNISLYNLDSINKKVKNEVYLTVNGFRFDVFVRNFWLFKTRRKDQRH